VDVDAHAHLGDTAHACHWKFLSLKLDRRIYAEVRRDLNRDKVIPAM
jgi:hypothetical protein